MSIKLKDVTVTFRKGNTAVDHISLEIPHGIYGLLGENGAGKTTLMRVLTTIVTPTSGSVMLDDLNYEEKNYEMIRRRIGYLPQELNLYPNLTMEESLCYMGELSGIPHKVCKQRIDEYLEKTDLVEQRHKKNRQLSGGMKRRVGLVQALLHEPDFLIVDEPTSGLDPEERIRIRNLLVDFSKHRTVLFSTHVVEDLASTCNQLSIMHQGSFIYSGSTQDLMKLASGHVWVCQVKDESEVRWLEDRYSITSKQYVEEGMRIKIISEEKPDMECRQPEITLEDAYMYILA